MKAFVKDKINMIQKLKFVMETVENIWFTAFSPFPKMFSKAFFLKGRYKSQDYVVKS